MYNVLIDKREQCTLDSKLNVNVCTYQDSLIQWPVNMADGGEVSGRSEQCQPCSRKGRTNAVVKFCYTCQLSYCSDCLGHHDELFDHTQLQSADNGSSTVTEESLELCDDHRLPITLYCNEEKTFGCITCMDANHKSCKQVIYLPVSAKALLQDPEFTNLNELLDKTIQELETIKLKQQPQLSTLIEDNERCLKNVNDYQTRILEKINAVFKSTTDKIDQQFEIMRAEKETNIQNVENSLAELESSRSRLQQFQDIHVQQFIEVKKCQDYIRKAEPVSKEAADNPKVEGMDTVVDTRLDDLLTGLESLATVMRRGPIEVKKKYQIDVSLKEDTQTCDISASCVLPDSSILLVDHSNKKLKRLDGETLAITDTYSTEKNPIGVCCFDETKVAMTTCDNKLTILAILPNLRPIRKLTFDHYCGYVANYKDKLLITDVNKALYIYTMQGSLLRKITTDTQGIKLFSNARHVVVNDTGDKLFVTDFENGLLILNRQWIAVNRLKALRSSGTRGVCLNEVGGAFVCGYTANKVVYVNSEGKQVLDVLTEADRLRMPKSVCFQGTRRRIFVSQESRNEMIVCELI